MADDDNTKPVAVAVYAGLRDDESVVRESILVAPLGGERFRLLKSPGLVQGVAAGDIVAIDPHGVCTAVHRAGNVCVQVYSFECTDEVDAFLTPLVVQAGGYLDGRSARQLVYTLPVSVGFEVIEGPFKALEQAFPGLEWLYGNVYGADGVTPLNWWATTRGKQRHED